jgi:hypothetical protein
MSGAVWVVLTLFAQTAGAWSSMASHTENDIRNLAGTLESYRVDTGSYPDPHEYWLTLQQAGMWYLREPGPARDLWGQPLVYRLPGKHGAFDLYSVGPDGVDSDGQRDDISSWAGVNDGFHWKRTWPLGRFICRLGIGLSIASFLLAFMYRWKVVLPIAGIVLCVSAILGCKLLMHPGVVRSRNIPLQHAILLAGLICIVLLIFLLMVRKDAFHRRQN